MMRPETEAELAEMIKAASGPLAIRGGGTRGMGALGEALSTSGLSGITLYEPGALTMVAQAGTPVAEVEAALAAENQRLAFEPMDHRALLGTEGTPTIGGVFAGNVSGPRRVQAGAARDFALGVRFVDGSGTIVKNGGRVMKNVTGYDLVKLMCGAWGTLGVLSEVSFKVLPMPETEATLVLEGLTPDTAVAAMSAAMGAPFDVSGAAFQDGKVVLRLEGFADSVAYRASELTARLASFAEGHCFDGAESAAIWADIRDVRALADAPGDIWRVSVRPSDGPRVIAAAGEGAAYVMDWAGGLVWLALPEGRDLRGKLAGVGGHATLVRTSGLRARFDPRGVLNPGLMAPAAA